MSIRRVVGFALIVHDFLLSRTTFGAVNVIKKKKMHARKWDLYKLYT